MSEAGRIGHEAASELTQTNRAFDLLEAEFMEAIASSAIGESAKREELFLAVNVLRRVRGALVAASQNVEIETYRALLKEQGFDVGPA